MSHKVFFGLLFANYIVIPVINIILTFIFVFSSDNLRIEPIESYVIFFTVVCFMRVIEYFTIIRRTVLLDAKIYLEAVRTIELKSKEQLE